MAENYKKRYESMKRMVEIYQDEILPQWREILDKNSLGVEDAMKVLKNHCLSFPNCEGCNLYDSKRGFCFFSDCELPNDWKLDGGVNDGI